MRDKNKCKPVANYGVAGKKRVACSKCGTVWEDGIPTSCPQCKRRVKKSKFVVSY